MSARRRRFTREFKLDLLKEIESGKPIATVCSEHHLGPKVVGRGRREKYGDNAFAGNGQVYKDSARIAKLERKLRELEAQRDFLKKVTMHFESLKKTNG